MVILVDPYSCLPLLHQRVDRDTLVAKVSGGGNRLVLAVGPTAVICFVVVVHGRIPRKRLDVGGSVHDSCPRVVESVRAQRQGDMTVLVLCRIGLREEYLACVVLPSASVPVVFASQHVYPR